MLGIALMVQRSSLSQSVELLCARVVDGPIFFIHAHVLQSRLLGFPKGFRVVLGSFSVPSPFSEIEVHFEKIPEKVETNLNDDEQYENFVLKSSRRALIHHCINIYMKVNLI